MTHYRPYGGPVFDVQAHAIKPSGYESIVTGIRNKTNLEDETATIIVDDVCKHLADELAGDSRHKILGEQNVQVVTVNTFFPNFPAERLLQMASDINQWMAETTANNSQVVGTATIPPPPAMRMAGNALDGEPYSQKAISLLRYAIVHLGMRAVLLASNYDGVFLGDAAFDRYFALAEELKVPVIIHPAVEPVEAPFIPRKNISTYSGFLNDQRTTLVDLVMSGVYEKYPGITIISTHLGGGILTSLGRFDVLSMRFPAECWYIDQMGQKKRLPRQISDYVRKLYFDCNNADVTDIMHAISVVGCDHLLTGTDFPWTGDAFTRKVLGQLSPEVGTKIAYNNAAELFGYKLIQSR